MNVLIEDWDRGASKLAGAADTTGLAMSVISPLVPLDNPQKLLVIGLNYLDQIEEIRILGLTTQEIQTWLCKPPTGRNDLFGPIKRP